MDDEQRIAAYRQESPQFSVSFDGDYVLGATRGRGKAKHIIAGAIYKSGDFKTLCGEWGSTKSMPWVAGQIRLDSGGWCKRCKASMRKLAREESIDDHA